MAKKSNEAGVKISPAKGRPMLNWVGKRPLKVVPALPAQHVEIFDPSRDLGKKRPSDIWQDWPDGYPKGGLLFHGDNKEVLAHLLANGFRGKVNLIYIDPPFDSGADYVRKIQLRGVKGTAKIEGETYTLGEQIQYTDIWANDNYLQFMYERLTLLRELLAEDGTIWLHCDDSKNHHLRMLLDEVFGATNFLNEIIHCYGEREKIQRTFNKKHQTIYWYAKSSTSDYVFNNEDVREEFSPVTITKYKYVDEKGRKYRIRGVNQEAAGPLRAKTDLKPEDECEYTYRDYIDKRSGPAPRDWFIRPFLNQAAGERENYPTQKNSAVLERILLSSSKPGAIVLDCFIGSGTTAAVAQKLGRRWIGCDINTGAIQTTSKRLQTIIAEQIEEAKPPKQQNFKGMEGKEDNAPQPAQLGLTVWRVNDYDLQIQHNEAVNLACEYIGVERTYGDAFFDGTLGKKLVKIIPFNHPLTPLDLEELKRELYARPDEDRDITLVNLGMELTAQKWLDDWNRHRKGGALNRIEVIELRTDPKYAGFIKHDPATAKISIKRTKDKIKVEIKDFISPTIIKRLDMEQHVFKAKVTDWRSMVDCVMIDPAYSGDVFNVTFSDVPVKKTDVVSGSYDFRAPNGKTTVAVKIIDMLGEEVLMAKEI